MAKANRLTLLKERARREIVNKGIGILSAKRDALLPLAARAREEAAARRKELDEGMHEAMTVAALARAVEPRERFESAAAASERELPVRIGFTRVWGVPVPEAQVPSARRSIGERGSLPGPRNPAVDETVRQFERLAGLMAETAAAEAGNRALGSALSAVTRRVNALEVKVLPECEQVIETVSRRLEEMAREETFRIKRYKQLRDRRTAAPEGRPWPSDDAALKGR